MKISPSAVLCGVAVSLVGLGAHFAQENGFGPLVSALMFAIDMATIGAVALALLLYAFHSLKKIKL